MPELRTCQLSATAWAFLSFDAGNICAARQRAALSAARARGRRRESSATAQRGRERPPFPSAASALPPGLGGRSRPAPHLSVHVACGRLCLAVHERHAACIDAARRCATTRPSHAVEIRFCGSCRASDRIVARPCSRPMSLPSRSTGVRIGFIGRVFSSRIPPSPWSTRHTAALWRKRHGKRPRGSLFPLSALFKSRLTRVARRVSRFDKKTVTVTRVCTYAPKRGPLCASSGGALCRPRS